MEAVASGVISYLIIELIKRIIKKLDEVNEKSKQDMPETGENSDHGKPAALELEALMDANIPQDGGAIEKWSKAVTEILKSLPEDQKSIVGGKFSEILNSVLSTIESHNLAVSKVKHEHQSLECREVYDFNTTIKKLNADIEALQAKVTAVEAKKIAVASLFTSQLSNIKSVYLTKISTQLRGTQTKLKAIEQRLQLLLKFGSLGIDDNVREKSTACMVNEEADKDPREAEEERARGMSKASSLKGGDMEEGRVRGRGRGRGRVLEGNAASGPETGLAGRGRADRGRGVDQEDTKLPAINLQRRNF